MASREANHHRTFPAQAIICYDLCRNVQSDFDHEENMEAEGTHFDETHNDNAEVAAKVCQPEADLGNSGVFRGVLYCGRSRVP
jgi:hypothetical protein